MKALEEKLLVILDCRTADEEMEKEEEEEGEEEEEKKKEKKKEKGGEELEELLKDGGFRTALRLKVARGEAFQGQVQPAY